MATVNNLVDGRELEYSLTPEQAVINAYLQYTMRNWMTWEYPTDLGSFMSKYPEAKVENNGLYIKIGDWCVSQDVSLYVV